MVSIVPMNVFYTTSYDADHPSSNIIDNDETTFFMTTGLYPQEIVFQFKRPAQVIRITAVTGKVRQMILYAAMDRNLTEWSQLETIDQPAQPIKIPETRRLNYQKTVYGVKLQITKGWGPFCAVYLIRVEGPTVREEDISNEE